MRMQKLIGWKTPSDNEAIDDEAINLVVASVSGSEASDERTSSTCFDDNAYYFARISSSDIPV